MIKKSEEEVSTTWIGNKICVRVCTYIYIYTYIYISLRGSSSGDCSASEQSDEFLIISCKFVVL